MTDVFGYFKVPGSDPDDDAILTGGLEVPIGSPIARLACQVSASRR